MGLILGIMIPFLIGSVSLLIVVCIIMKFVNRAKSTMRDVLGTDDLREFAKAREAEIAQTPKSVAGMTTIYVPMIQKDFPELNWVELKGIAEKHLTEYLTQEKKFFNVHIHQTEVFSYLKEAGTCVIVFQSGVQYLTGTAKVQARYNTHMMYIQDAHEYGYSKSYSSTCPHCGAAITDLGRKFCDYCGSEIIPVNIHVWELHKIEES